MQLTCLARRIGWNDFLGTGITCTLTSSMLVSQPLRDSTHQISYNEQTDVGSVAACHILPVGSYMDRTQLSLDLPSYCDMKCTAALLCGFGVFTLCIFMSYLADVLSFVTV